jgi:hypothetical protein
MKEAKRDGFLFELDIVDFSFTLTFPSRRLCKRDVPIIPDVVLIGLDLRKPTFCGLGVELGEG